MRSRALRHVAIMRNIKSRTRPGHGDRWIERILSILETCHLLGRSALEYLIDAAVAAHPGQPAPSLLQLPP